MKKVNLFLLPLAVMLLCASCMDDNYDLSEIDTNSRLYVNNLTVPLNIDPLNLDLMLDIADDSDIKTDAEGNYYFMKEGTFTSDPVNVDKIKFEKPSAEFSGGLSINLAIGEDVVNNIQFYASNMTLGAILADPVLMNIIGISPDMDILNVKFDESKTTNEITFTKTDVDANVKRIEKLGVEPATLNVRLKLNGISSVLKPFSLNNLKVIMPRGFILKAQSGITYDPEKGILKPDNGKFGLNQNYVADLSITFEGLNYDQLEEDGMKVFDPVKHIIDYKKKCSAEGEAVLKFTDLNANATFADVLALTNDDAINYECNVGFDNDLVISSFDGDIIYSMDDIVMDPVSISDVPEMLKENGTNIDLMNPQLYLSLNNQLYDYGIKVNSNLEIKGNNTITAPLNINNSEWTNIVMAPMNSDLYHSGYAFEEVKNLSKVVGSNDGQQFPQVLNIRVIKPQVPETKLLRTLALGSDIASVSGTWEFYTRLTLTDNTKIKYTKDWDDWGDEDLDGLTINKAVVSVTLQKDVELDAENVEFILIGKNGELRGQTSLTGAAKQDLVINLEGGPVSEIQGGKLNVRLKGTNKDLNKEQQIKISNLKVVIDGYYDREL